MKKGWSSCPAKIRVLFLAVENGVIIEHIYSHVHQEQEGQNQLSNDVKAIILQGIRDGLTVIPIVKKLQRENLHVPTRKQMENFVARQRMKEGCTSVTDEELKTYCGHHCSIPVNEDEPFVLESDIDCKNRVQVHTKYSYTLYLIKITIQINYIN